MLEIKESFQLLSLGSVLESTECQIWLILCVKCLSNLSSLVCTSSMLSLFQLLQLVSLLLVFSFFQICFQTSTRVCSQIHEPQKFQHPHIRVKTLQNLTVTHLAELHLYHGAPTCPLLQLHVLLQRAHIFLPLKVPL